MCPYIVVLCALTLVFIGASMPDPCIHFICVHYVDTGVNTARATPIGTVTAVAIAKVVTIAKAILVAAAAIV